jgi:hypothetical protein
MLAEIPVPLTNKLPSTVEIITPPVASWVMFSMIKPSNSCSPISAVFVLAIVASTPLVMDKRATWISIGLSKVPIPPTA